MLSHVWPDDFTWFFSSLLFLHLWIKELVLWILHCHYRNPFLCWSQIFLCDVTFKKNYDSTFNLTTTNKQTTTNLRFGLQLKILLYTTLLATNFKVFIQVHSVAKLARHFLQWMKCSNRTIETWHQLLLTETEMPFFSPCLTNQVVR